jgi:hypothetical protein
MSLEEFVKNISYWTPSLRVSDAIDLGWHLYLASRLHWRRLHLLFTHPVAWMTESSRPRDFQYSDFIFSTHCCAPGKQDHWFVLSPAMQNLILILMD